MKKCLVIFSGGQDSTTCLGWAKNRYSEVVAISFIYGQKHNIEIDKAKEICKLLNVEHHIIDISFFGEIVESALTHNGNVNMQHSKNSNLPSSFVPNRNMLFITIAHAFAQKINANSIITGVCETDFSGYPDCRKVFIDSVEETLKLSSETNIPILTPLMNLNKSEIFKLSQKEKVLDIVLKYSHTCYNGSTIVNDYGYGCGDCSACKLRKNGYNKFKDKK